MNAKKAKGLRKFLRTKGIDYRDRKYAWFNVSSDNKVLSPTICLHRDCGKRKYKQMKTMGIL